MEKRTFKRAVIIGMISCIGFFATDLYTGKTIKTDESYKQEEIRVDKKSCVRKFGITGVRFSYKDDLTIKYDFTEQADNKIPCKIRLYSDSYESGGYHLIEDFNHEFTPKNNTLSLTAKLGGADVLKVITSEKTYQIHMVQLEEQKNLPKDIIR